MDLRDIKIVDLGASELDPKTTNKIAGEYAFISKRYVGQARRSPYYFYWERHVKENDYLDSRSARYDGYSYVTVEDDFWPEPIPPDGDGKYVFKDVVLMKGPIKDEVEKSLKNKRKSEGDSVALRNSFNAVARAAGAEISDEMMDKLRPRGM